MLEILKTLKAPFPPEDHKKRSLPGGGRWFFIPWQKIKERLDAVCPEWGCSFSDPVIAGELVVIRCRITIASVTREGVGNSDAMGDRTSGGGYKFGSPIEKATADALKNAAEMFGVGAYLDDQQFVVKYLHSKGDYRGVKFAQENNWKADGAMGTPKTVAKAQNGSLGQSKINEAQAKTFCALATRTGYTKQGAIALLKAHGLSKSADIPESLYQKICAQASDRVAFAITRAAAS
jgi:hypothetical protein